MKGDYTRFTFRKDRHYSGVRMQQGRVQLDSDWNEQLDINTHIGNTTRLDTIGLSGAPMENAGFAIEARDCNLYALPGRYYVDGILCENEKDLRIDKQPDLPDVPLPETCCLYTAYLDVWTRTLTALEENYLRETALLGPDTATRAKTICQIRLEKMDADDMECCPMPGPGWKPGNAPQECMLGARARRYDREQDPCKPLQGTGYKRLENHLYRIEVHNGGPVGEATFKWSRNNACYVTRLITVDNRILSFDDPAKKAQFEFKPKQWIEISDEGRTLRGEPGVMAEIEQIDGNNITIKEWLGNNGKDVCPHIFGNKPTIRIWDRDENKTTGPAKGVHPIVEREWTSLESGIEIRFESIGSYKAGDFWIVPARVATGDIEWPRDASNTPIMRPPHGIKHSYAPVAILKHSGEWEAIRDLRRFFPSINRLTNLFYIGGDGQEIIPDERLPNSVKVGVSNGQTPVEGASVRFEIFFPSKKDKGRGWLSPKPESDDGEYSITCLTNKKGFAECYWWPDKKYANQQVTATLLDHNCEPSHIPIRFSATLIQAQDVAYKPPRSKILKGVDNVGEALDRLNKLSADQIAVTTPGSGKEAGIKTVQQAIDKLRGEFGADEGGTVGGGIASAIAALANSVSVLDDVKRRNAILNNPVKPDSSVLNSTLGLYLNFIRISFTLTLELLDLQNAGLVDGNNRLGDSASLDLDVFNGPFGRPVIDKRLTERLRTLSKDRYSDNAIDSLLDLFGANDMGNNLNKAFDTYDTLSDRLKEIVNFTIAEVIGEKLYDKGDPADNALAFIDYINIFETEFGGKSTWNGIPAFKRLMDDIYTKIIGSRNLDYSALAIISDIILDTAGRIWKGFANDLLVDAESTDIPNNIKWSTSIANFIDCADRGVSGNGLVRIFDNNEDKIIDILVQPPMESGSKATWLLFKNKLCRIKHSSILNAIKNDSLECPEPDLTLTPEINRIFTDFHLSGGFLAIKSASSEVISIHTDQLEEMSGSYNISKIKESDKNAAIKTIYANITSRHSPIILINGKANRPPTMIRRPRVYPYIIDIENNNSVRLSKDSFDIKRIIGAWTMTFGTGISEKEYLLLLLDEDRQSILLGTLDNTTKTPRMDWFTSIVLCDEVRAIGVIDNQLLLNLGVPYVNEDNDFRSAFFPVLALLPDHWGDNEDAYRAALETVMEDGSKLIEVQSIKGYKHDGNDRKSTIVFNEGYFMDAYAFDSIIATNTSLGYLDLYGQNGDISPERLTTVDFGSTRTMDLGTGGAPIISGVKFSQNAHSKEGDRFLITRALDNRVEFKLVDLSFFEGGA
jgi:hypothetical protein